jgi:hypothetical protein
VKCKKASPSDRRKIIVGGNMDFHRKNEEQKIVIT